RGWCATTWCSFLAMTRLRTTIPRRSLRFRARKMATMTGCSGECLMAIRESSRTAYRGSQRKKKQRLTGYYRGWTTSAKLRQVLISYVARELNNTYRASGSAVPSAEAIDTAIKTGFTRLDDEIVHQSVQKVLQSNSKIVAAETLAPALSGSCALLSF